MPPAPFSAGSAPSAALNARLLAELAREIYALSGDLRAFGPDAQGAVENPEARLAALLAEVRSMRSALAAARPAWLSRQREAVGVSAETRELKLHIGCGGHALPGWINLDVHPAPFCWNVLWGLPFADGAASHVFVSHLLEHLFFPGEALAFLRELKRTLGPGGRVRLIVPDVAALIDAYVREDRAFFAARGAHWPGARGDGPLLAQFLNYAGAGPEPGYFFEAHKFGYDFETLRDLLERAGFSSVTRSAYMQSEDPDLRVDEASAVAGAGHAGAKYSLFVEARVAGSSAQATRGTTDSEHGDLVQAARAEMQAKRPRAAAALLQQARRLAPDNAHLARSHGVALLAAGDEDAAEQALREALRLDPDLPATHLHLGRLLERRGRAWDAVSAYFRAITKAQSRELWLNEATTPTWLQADVLHAMQQVREQRVPLLMALLEPLEAEHGRTAMLRVRAALSNYLGVEPHPPADARQAPRFLHVPGLQARPWLDNTHAELSSRLQAHFPCAREEALDLLESRRGLQPFLEGAETVDLSPYLGGAQARWDALFFYRHGLAVPAGAAAAPRTSAFLKDLPLVRIPGHAPEICFSVLAPGTHIKPHHGVTNARVVVHLGLVIPDGCRLTVGGEARPWREGETWVFDDTFLHEAINESDAPRVILLMDAWHPELDAAERQALTSIIEGIGEFHRGPGA